MLARPARRLAADCVRGVYNNAGMNNTGGSDSFDLKQGLVIKGDQEGSTVEQPCKHSLPEAEWATGRIANTCARLLESWSAIEVCKTGYARSVGFNAAVAVGGQSGDIVVVVLGERSPAARTARILDVAGLQ